jgi:hypothetical protein
MAGSGVDNIVNSPVNVFWRIETAECLDLNGIVAADLDGTYLTINSAKDATEYYIWFDLDAGSTDPAPAGKTAIEVDVTTGQAASAVATAIAAAVDALGDFSASATGTQVDIERTAVGQTTDTADVDSGIAVFVRRKGKDYDLGLLQGEVPAVFAPSLLDITTHQNGVTVVSSVLQGFESNEASMTLQETTLSKLKELYGIYGSRSFTPASGTEVAGAGTGQVGKNMLVEAARLEFIPTNIINSDLSYQYTIPLALPVPNTLTFSGEAVRVLESTWRGYPDLTAANQDLNSVILGDSSQTGIL